MLIETTIAETNASLVSSTAPMSPLGVLFRAVRILGKLILAGLLVSYLAGWVQDFQRVRQLEAEPTPPFKVITKYEAWERIYRRPALLLRRPTPDLTLRERLRQLAILGEASGLSRLR